MDSQEKTSDSILREVINKINSEPDSATVGEQQQAWAAQKRVSSNTQSAIDSGKKAIQGKLRWGKR